MAGPGPNIPGYPYSTKPAGKPAAKPSTLPAAKPGTAVTAVPASATRVANGVWHAVGTHLPVAITRNKAARKAMLRLSR